MSNSSEQLASPTSIGKNQQWLAILLIGFVVGGFVLYWFGTLLFIAAMWIVVIALLAAAVYSGYLASKATETDQRAGLWMICGGAVLVAMVLWWLIPGGGTASHATWTYWTELSRICQQSNAFSNKTGEPANPEAAANMLKQAAKLSEQMANEISELPTNQVDSAAVSFGADQVEMLHEAALIMGDMRSLIEQDRQLQGASASMSVLAESFVRGLLGDPLGKASEFATAGQQLSGKARQLQQRWAKIQQKVVASSAQEIRLRSTLSNKYGREFPHLTPKNRGEK